MNKIRVDLLPLGRHLEVAPGTRLQDVLFEQGAEFPCGGKGRCKGCRIRVLEGVWPPGADDERLLAEAERAAGWRLACQARVTAPLVLDLGQWEAPVLADDTPFPFTPREGLGVAIDAGTTTLAAQLLDLQTARVLGVATAFNEQARHGADVMSRVEFAQREPGQQVLEREIRAQTGELVARLLEGRGASELRDVVLVGNAVMHHLFSGRPVAPFGQHPFASPHLGPQRFAGAELGWESAPTANVCFLPCLGGFVGSDLLAGMLATRLHEATALAALIDLGTNGEIVLGDRHGLLCASTAAGPAFEGARIGMGMRAATGAIAAVVRAGDGLACRVLGNGPARGICGSGLVDAAAVALELGWLSPDGRLLRGAELPLAGAVSLTQRDLRELQLAKGAITAGLRLLLERRGAGLADLDTVWLAGAFGNCVDRDSAP
ncbi:MAG: DUF4445 domain-containing protein, partial [Planctomycetes bacterium]|nr:DUF4445 domain-containing protein [Planctomycetota bacterium]